MQTSKLFSLVKNSRAKLLMSTQVGTVNVAEHKLQHYRDLDALDTNRVKPADWDQAKPFESIPGPKPLPLVGNSWRFFLPKIGDFYGQDMVQVQTQLNKKYGDIAILKGLLGLEPMVMLFNVKDFETLHRNEGIWPIRGGIESFVHYRNMRKDILASGGLATTDGEEWFKFRTVVNPILMQPKTVAHYSEKMSYVADEFIDNMRYFSKQNAQGQMPDDFQQEIYKWSLESIGIITLDVHLGCLKRDSQNAEAQELIRNVLRMFDLMYVLDFLPSAWKYISTPAWREFVKTMDAIINTNLKYINQYVDKIEKGEIKVNDNEVPSALYQLLKVDKTVAVAMSADMLTAGVDTTGRILAAALYYLAKNPETQQKLREEAFTLLKHKQDPVTKEVLNKAAYTRAVVKETSRLRPIGLGNSRTTKKDLILAGYQIPSGTRVLTSSLLLSRQDEHYPKAKEFIPERWLRETTGEMSHKSTNPFVSTPFGFGPRSCIGKRLANLELETALLKVARNFELKWPHEDIVFATRLLHGVAGPLKLHVKELDG